MPNLYVLTLSDDKPITKPIFGYAEARRVAYNLVTKTYPRGTSIYVQTYPKLKIVGQVEACELKSYSKVAPRFAVTFTYPSRDGDYINEYVLLKDGNLGEFVGSYRS